MPISTARRNAGDLKGRLMEATGEAVNEDYAMSQMISIPRLPELPLEL